MLRALSGVCLISLAAASLALSDVPLRPAAGVHLVVPALVNDKGPYPFILDTGADATGVYQWFAEAQHLKPGKSVTIGGMTGSVDVPTYHLDSVSVDGQALSNIDADGLPNRHDVEIEAGAVGNDLMDGTITVFDFPCKRVEIHAKPFDVTKVLTRSAQKMLAGTVENGTQLTLHVRVRGVEGVAILDTGSSDTRINTLFAHAAGIDPAAKEFRDAEPIFGVNSKAMPSRKGPIGIVTFAGISAPEAEARVMDLAAFKEWGVGDQPAMILGLDLMQGHRLIYDHAAKTFWFDQSNCSR
jgi:hypothetical protein